ncbi:hypothetical protein ACS0TY_030212 [Phlomoides rotata]
MPSKLKKAIAAVKDQTSIGLAKVSSNASTNLEVSVLKATSHDDVPFDEKYISEVLQLVSSNKIHAAACARAIGKRISRTRNWIVALKSLMLVLRIFQDGDPYFPREVLHAMKKGAKILNLSSFRDDSNSSPWDFTSFVRIFALYLDERLECFLTGKLQRRYTHEGPGSTYQRSRSRGARRQNEPVRDMNPTMLLDRMSYWQRLLDRAIATRPTGAAKTNRMVQIALYAIVQESFDLYKDISDGLSLVLDSFFHLQYQNCVTAFQTCLKAVKQFEELSCFFSLCKSLGVGRSSEYPSVQAISEEVIETLQEFLKDQSSFPSIVKPGNQASSGGAPPKNVRTRSVRHDSVGGQSDFSATTDGSDRSSDVKSQSASLEDLISAAETWTAAPAISIDLETYSAAKRDDTFWVGDTGSSRSLPVNISGADLMSLDDWTDDDDDDDDEEEQKQDQQQDQEEKQKGILDSSASKNWETVLSETLTSLSSPPVSSQSHTDNNTNTLTAFPEQPPTAEENPSTATNCFDIVLFEAAPPPDLQYPRDDPYNPFLQDLMELSVASNANQQSPTPVPTFQATPTFSAQNPNLNSISEEDPFACGAEFREQVFCSNTDQQSLQQQQQLWLQNQNKIISKHFS